MGMDDSRRVERRRKKKYLERGWGSGSGSPRWELCLVGFYQGVGSRGMLGGAVAMNLSLIFAYFFV